MALDLPAILAATVASYIAGSVWYLVLGRRWRAAVGWVEGPVPYRPSPVELGIALIGQLVLATSLAVLVHPATLAAGIVAGCAVWLGLVLPTLATNVMFQRRTPALIWMDGGHWLLYPSPPRPGAGRSTRKSFLVLFLKKTTFLP